MVRNTYVNTYETAKYPTPGLIQRCFMKYQPSVVPKKIWSRAKDVSQMTGGNKHDPVLAQVPNVGTFIGVFSKGNFPVPILRRNSATRPSIAEKSLLESLQLFIAAQPVVALGNPGTAHIQHHPRQRSAFSECSP